jgi:hypothetical protein
VSERYADGDVMGRGLWQAATLIAIVSLLSCVSQPAVKGRGVFLQGLNEVRLVPEEEHDRNTHPVTLSPAEIGTLLHRVLYGERRNWLHRLISGNAPKSRAFREEEIAILASPLARALGEAKPDERVYFHLAGAGPSGTAETTTGWIFVRDPILYLVLSEVHDLHAPGPDVSKYQREMPDVPEAPTPFTLTFDPQDYQVTEISRGSWLAPDQLEELDLQFRRALSELPPFKKMDGRPESAPPSAETR